MNDSDDAWLLEERLTHSIIGAFFQVYNRLGFGFLESVYVQAIERELRARGLRVGREVAVRIYYDGVELCQYRIDMVVTSEESGSSVRSAPKLLGVRVVIPSRPVGKPKHHLWMPEENAAARTSRIEFGERSPIARYVIVIANRS